MALIRITAEESVKSTYTVFIEPTETGFSAFVPDLPGCVAAASTLEEPRELITGAIEFHIHGMRMNGEMVPEPTRSNQLKSLRLNLETAHATALSEDATAAFVLKSTMDL